jgi:hypothetical protein
MHDTCTYQIELRGRVDVGDLNAGSPLQIAGARQMGEDTRLTVYADQSALVGLLRHLHGRGFLILSLQRQPRN